MQFYKHPLLRIYLSDTACPAIKGESISEEHQRTICGRKIHLLRSFANLLALYMRMWATRRWCFWYYAIYFSQRARLIPVATYVRRRLNFSMSEVSVTNRTYRAAITARRFKKAKRHWEKIWNSCHENESSYELYFSVCVIRRFVGF